MRTVVSTIPRAHRRQRPVLAAVLAAPLALPLSGCVAQSALPGPAVTAPALSQAAAPDQGHFTMPDGAALPYRAWLPAGRPQAVMLALHGFNDSRDAWELPGPALAASGIAVFAPDQRGFGAAPGRGLWPGGTALVDDARTMALLLRAQYPGVRLVLAGESMGGAVLMCLATGPAPPPVDGYVLISPAVWGRAKMNLFLRTLLWASVHTVPGLTLTGGGLVKVRATDNHAALVRLSTDPLTIKRTRVDTIRGLVDLMDAALAAAPRMTAPSLFLYGGKDEIVPPEATAATWHALPGHALQPGPRVAFYPDGFHLLLRDLDRDRPIEDVAAWILRRPQPLPSGSESAAAAWLARQG